jgi:hypothetical protein
MKKRKVYTFAVGKAVGFAAVLFVLIFTACSSPAGGGDPPIPAVYVAGFYGNGSTDVACYWKDGARTGLPGGTVAAKASSIAVSGVRCTLRGIISTAVTMWPVTGKTGQRPTFPAEPESRRPVPSPCPGVRCTLRGGITTAVPMWPVTGKTGQGPAFPVEPENAAAYSIAVVP